MDRPLLPSFLLDRRTYTRIQAFTPGKPASWWVGSEQLALVCGHISLFECGVLDASRIGEIGEAAMRLLLARGPDFFERCIRAGCVDVALWRRGNKQNILFLPMDSSMVALLIRYGAVPDVLNDFGQSALQVAVQFAEINRCIALIEAGADSSRRDVHVYGPNRPMLRLRDTVALCLRSREGGLAQLREWARFQQVYEAAKAGDIDRLRHLVEVEGLDPNDERCMGGWGMATSPLMASLRVSSESGVACAEFLVEKGAELTQDTVRVPIGTLNCRGSVWCLDRDPALLGGLETFVGGWVAEALRLVPADLRAARAALCDVIPFRDLAEAAKRGDVREVKRFLALGLDPSDERAAGEFSDAALGVACEAGQFKVVRLLLEGAEWELSDLRTALARAYQSWDVRSMLLVLEYGVRRFPEEMFTLNPDGTPPFHLRLRAAVSRWMEDREDGLRMLRELAE